jgi:hypothetical protein
MKKTYENLTLDQLRAMLDETVEKHNEAENSATRIEARVEIKDIEEAYNELSLLTVYSKCMEDAQPLVAFVKKFYYPTVSVKVKAVNEVVDGVAKSSEAASVTENDRKMSLFKFIDWAKERNKFITADKNYKVETNKARKAINELWENFKNSKDKTEMSKNAVKKVLQPMFDALIFIKGKSGKNAVIANGDTAFYIIALAGELKTTADDNKNPNFTIEFLKSKSWDGHILNMLKMAVEGKTFDVVYGDPEEEVAEKAKPEVKKDKTEAEPETKA